MLITCILTSSVVLCMVRCQMNKLLDREIENCNSKCLSPCQPQFSLGCFLYLLFVTQISFKLKLVYNFTNLVQSSRRLQEGMKQSHTSLESLRHGTAISKTFSISSAPLLEKIMYPLSMHCWSRCV